MGKYPLGSDHKCPRGLRVVNGLVKTSGSLVGDLAVYHCEETYHLIGTQVRECLENGSWSGQSSICEGMPSTD